MSESVYQYVLDELQAWKGRWRLVSEQTGISKRTIEKIATGESQNPGVRTIEDLATFFRKHPADSNAA